MKRSVPPVPGAADHIPATDRAAREETRTRSVFRAPSGIAFRPRSWIGFGAGSGTAFGAGSGIAFGTRSVIVRGLALFAALVYAAMPDASPAASAYAFEWALPTPTGNALGGAAYTEDGVGYAVGDRGTLLRTSDGGVTWSLVQLFPELSADLHDVLVLGPGELIAVGGAPGIFRSTDSGDSWASVANPSTATLTDLAPIDGASLCAIGEDGQVLRSEDLGATWSLMPAPSPHSLVEQLWLDAANGYVLGRFTARRTTDGGQTWTVPAGVTENEPFSEIFFTDAQHGTILSDFHIWRSSDGGASWSEDFLPNPVVYAGDTVVLGPLEFITVTNLEGAVIARTVDGGHTFEILLWAGGGGFLDFDRLPGGALVAVTDSGDCWRSTDDGETWANATWTAHEPPKGTIGAIGVGPGGTGAAGTKGTPDVFWFHTEDGGASWTHDPDGPWMAFAEAISFWDAERGVAAGDYGRMWRTTDGGATWVDAPLPNPPNNGRAYNLSIAAPGVAFAAVSGQSQGMVYRSTDYGASWHPRTTGIPANGGVYGISFVDANLGFVSGSTGSGPRIYKTTDGGGSWSPVGTSGLPTWAWDLHWTDAMTGLATVYIAPGGIFRTTNGGASWHHVFGATAHGMSFAGTNGVATTGDFLGSGIVYATQDGGVTWEEVLLPSPSAGTCVTATEDGFFVGADNDGILLATRIDPTGVDAVDEADTGGDGSREGREGDGSPSWLRAIASVGVVVEVAFEMPRHGPADLAVFDLEGRRIVTLARGEFERGETITRAWDGRTGRGGRVGAGVYFVRFETAGSARAVKVVLTR